MSIGTVPSPQQRAECDCDGNIGTPGCKWPSCSRTRFTISDSPDPYHEEFLAVVERLAKIRLEKVAQYGFKRYMEHDPEVNRWMCFSDVYRKFIRLEQQVKSGDIAGMIETYTDLANYAIMGVQILSRPRQEGKPLTFREIREAGHGVWCTKCKGPVDSLGRIHHKPGCSLAE